MDFKKHCKTFINAVLAGLLIGIAGTVYLATPNAMLGAFLFAFGLMTILCYEFKLYTGAIGYLATKKRSDIPDYLISLLLIWLGNLLGCHLVGTLVRHTRSYAKFAERVSSICADKLADSPSSLLILACFCGLLMYLGVETYRRKELGKIFRFAAVFLCVALFILSGFEHCIANMYYFSVADLWSWHTLTAILIMTVGNSIGGCLLPLADKIRR